MPQGWKKIQATLLAWARAEKKAVEEARASNASTMDKKGRDLPSSESSTTASPWAPSAPALSTTSTSRSHTGGTDPVGLLAAHGRPCHGRHGPDAVVQVVQAPVSNIIRKPWLKKMPHIVAKKEAASCPLSRSPEGKISDDTSESFSSTSSTSPFTGLLARPQNRHSGGRSGGITIV
jgi:hypothetical protein